jgi:hypothetical protein
MLEGVGEDREKWWATPNKIMDILVPQLAENFLTNH